MDAIHRSSADLQSYDNRKKFKITLLGKKVNQGIHGGRDSNLWAPDCTHTAVMSYISVPRSSQIMLEIVSVSE